MSFKRISIGNTTSLMADTIVIDRAQSELIYGSVIGYATAMQISLKELKTPNLNCYIPNAGNYRTGRTGYSIESKRDASSDYTHTIFYAKDKVTYREDGTEQIEIYIYCNNEEELREKLYAKVAKYSSVPVLEEWKDYLLTQLKNNGKIRELYVFHKYEEAPFKAYRAFFNKNDVKNIVKSGLSAGEIKIMGNNNPSPVLDTITGLSS